MSDIDFNDFPSDSEDYNDFDINVVKYYTKMISHHKSNLACVKFERKKRHAAHQAERDEIIARQKHEDNVRRVRESLERRVLRDEKRKEQLAERTETNAVKKQFSKHNELEQKRVDTLVNARSISYRKQKQSWVLQKLQQKAGKTTLAKTVKKERIKYEKPDKHLIRNDPYNQFMYSDYDGIRLYNGLTKFSNEWTDHVIDYYEKWIRSLHRERHPEIEDDSVIEQEWLAESLKTNNYDTTDPEVIFWANYNEFFSPHQCSTLTANCGIGPVEVDFTSLRNADKLPTPTFPIIKIGSNSGEIMNPEWQKTMMIVKSKRSKKNKTSIAPPVSKQLPKHRYFCRQTTFFVVCTPQSEILYGAKKFVFEQVNSLVNVDSWKMCFGSRDKFVSFLVQNVSQFLDLETREIMFHENIHHVKYMRKEHVKKFMSGETKIPAQPKLYQLKVFRNGQIQIPGVKHPNYMDILQPLKHVLKYIQKVWAKPLDPTPKLKFCISEMRNYSCKLIDPGMAINIKKMRDCLVHFKNVVPIKNAANIERSERLAMRFPWFQNIHNNIQKINPVRIADIGDPDHSPLKCKLFTPNPMNPNCRGTIKINRSGKINIDNCVHKKQAYLITLLLCVLVYLYGDKFMYKTLTKKQKKQNKHKMNKNDLKTLRSKLSMFSNVPQGLPSFM